MRIPEKSFEAVIFDMDGLLLDTERLYLDGYRRSCEAFDLPHDHDFYVSMIGLNGESTKAALRHGMAGLIDPDVFEEKWGIENAILFESHIPAKPGVGEFVTGLLADNIPIAIATSTKTSRAWNHLERAGLGELFSIVVGGDQVERSKPSPDIYLKAAKTLGVAPENCVAFEDSENGVRAAMAAGMLTIQVPDLKEPSEEFCKLGHLIARDLKSGAAMVGLGPA